MLTRQLKFKTFCGSMCQGLDNMAHFSSIQHAHQLFVESPQANISSISNSLFSYIRQNYSFETVNIFKTQSRCNHPRCIDEDMVAIALNACRGEPKIGAQLHGFAVSSGSMMYRPVFNSLMNMYCKSRRFDQALDIFNNLDDPDIVSYNTILSGFQDRDDALSFACQMNFDGLVFDPVTYSKILSFCLDGKGFLFGCQLHSMIMKSGLNCEVFVGNAMITMYSRWGCIVEAEKVFDELPIKDLVSWNAILSGYSQEGSYGMEAISAFIEMIRQGMKFDHVSLTGAVSACGHVRNLAAGRQMHCLSIKAGCGTQVSVCNVLTSTYAKCEVYEDAKLVFQGMVERNVVSWTTMISIIEDEALALFHEMRMDGVYPNDVTFIGLLHAITIRNLGDEGQMIHGLCIKTSFISKQTSAITMGDSVKVFEELSNKGIVSWNALISGYAQNALFQESLQAFFAAITETHPNEYTFGSVLCAIGAAEAISLRHGQRCHSHLLKLGLNTNPIVSSSLLDMYAKRGSLHESKSVFEETDRRSQVAWTAILSAHSRHGDYKSVMCMFKEMENEGIRPDSITFLALLTSCGRNGMVDMGRQIFDLIIKEHMIEPSAEHYSCMVDMLGRAGRLKEAEELVRRIPAGPGLSALQSLLGACKIHGNVEMGRRIADSLMEMEPKESGSYVLMSNLYAENADWERAAKMRRRMRDKGVRKEVGFSWVDVGISDGCLYMHGFSSDDMSHPRSEEIYKMADCLGLEMKSDREERIFGTNSNSEDSLKLST
ncbi:hypothetical protein Nepgr_022386 [Nepenthes gracilis]|uniref:Pentatricopeptide repeat-containing protein n=1 Tax=Nepenthes gracilis TaxID=150966 RepID=A0AAD3T0N6_NEPGR|nr:hypothetical protein Nepgr_022386 [Nepenthes gracilis]